jgi:hypothetical protein
MISLPKDFQSELRIAGFTHTKARRGAVAECLGDLAEAGTGKCHVRIRPVRPVEKVEDLNPEFSGDSLGNRSFLEYREIHRSKPWPIERVSADVAERSGCRLSEDSRIEVLYGSSVREHGDVSKGILRHIRREGWKNLPSPVGLRLRWLCGNAFNSWYRRPRSACAVLQPRRYRD